MYVLVWHLIFFLFLLLHLGPVCSHCQYMCCSPQQVYVILFRSLSGKLMSGNVISHNKLLVVKMYLVWDISPVQFSTVSIPSPPPTSLWISRIHIVTQTSWQSAVLLGWAAALVLHLEVHNPLTFLLCCLCFLTSLPTEWMYDGFACFFISYFTIWILQFKNKLKTYTLFKYQVICMLTS